MLCIHIDAYQLIQYTSGRVYFICTDSLQHRAEVRQKLAGDPAWIGNYFSKILPWLQRQENDVLACLPGTNVIEAPGKGIMSTWQMISKHSMPTCSNEI